jgi:EAL domain-containing protein (putative c-di-GMP-specific phosphodiesterase class I)
MYRAKENGRDRAELFDRQLREHVVARLDTERELRGALERGGLAVYYQPVISLPDGGFAGFEALLRWEHPSRGLLAPAEFLTVAEDSGLMRPIGEWVRGQVLTTVSRWRREHPEWGPFVTSINLSAPELSDPHLGTSIGKAVLDSDLEPSRLSFEIREQVLLQDAEQARALLGELRELGVHLVLDDFGTGSSPLVHLKRFRMDGVKIDRMFIAGVGADPFDDAVVDAVIDLSGQLNLSSVAMGVETSEQAERLRAVGCRQAQGFWFGAPMPSGTAQGWVSQSAS